MIEKKGSNFIRQHQQVACITFTNVTSNEISRKIDGHPAILSSTIHSFLWSIVGNFQANLRKILPTLHGWPERLEAIGVLSQKVGYDELGRRNVTESHISIGHDDVLLFASELLKELKFRTLLSNRYPIILIDEYQDTNKEIVESIKQNILDTENGQPLIGFFGDHWQKIYGEGCGSIEHEKLTVIDKQSNFRSSPKIVDCLNRMRPELMQQVSDSSAIGNVAIYHTNNWVGQRRTNQHWAGDLPQADAHRTWMG